MNINTIPKHHIHSAYYSYLASYFHSKANAIQREIGVETPVGGLTPDIVKFNPDYRKQILQMNSCYKFAKSVIPKAKELKIITREYHKLYDTGQRSQIRKLIESVGNEFIQKDEIVNLESFENVVVELLSNKEV